MQGTNEDNADVIINVYDTGIRCVTNPGTYIFLCEFKPNIKDVNIPIYSSSGSGATMTFTAMNDRYMEGYFSACANVSLQAVYWEWILLQLAELSKETI